MKIFAKFGGIVATLSTTVILASCAKEYPVQNPSETPQGTFKATEHIGWFKTKKVHLRCFSASTERIYASTIHELAHSAHWFYDTSYSANASDIVIESWSTAAEVYFTRKLYPNYETGLSRGCYTNIAADLMDAAGLTKVCYYSKANLKAETVDSPLSYIDNVSGYTIKQIQDAIFVSTTWRNFETNLSRYNNPTKAHLNETFVFWSTL